MPTAPLRRPRALPRFFGLILAVLCTAGQVALALHNHPIELRRDGRPAFSRHHEAEAEAHCRLCALSVQSRAAAVSAPPAAAAQAVVSAVFDVPSAAFGRTPSLRPSSRAPPAV